MTFRQDTLLGFKWFRTGDTDVFEHELVGSVDYLLLGQHGMSSGDYRVIERQGFSWKWVVVKFDWNMWSRKIFICNCCGCCCKALAFITKYKNPGLIAKSNFYATIEAETCEGCEACLDRCQVGAIHMADDIAVITLEKCIGCGLCVSTCPTEAISMIHKEPDGLSHIYADDFDLSLARSEDTGKAFPFE